MMGLHNSFSCLSFIKPTSGTIIASHLEYYRERFPRSLERNPSSNRDGDALGSLSSELLLHNKVPQDLGF